MAKQIEVRCPPDIAAIMIEALRWFVEVNYPRGADECSIAAREALLDLVARFERELLPNGVSRYSSRIRAFLCEAVKAYLASQELNTGQRFSHRCAVVTDVCRGNSYGEGFAAAAARDATDAAPGIKWSGGPV
ncbi:MAG: hypothetical protein PVI91_06550 [Gammaproteobacteria bacterium]|jgi:hypothetical protein